MRYGWIGMRGEDTQQTRPFSYGRLEERLPARHPPRPIRARVEEALREMSARFDEICREGGPSLDCP